MGLPEAPMHSRPLKSTLEALLDLLDHASQRRALDALETILAEQAARDELAPESGRRAA
jgi:hypothetical protein